MKTLVTMLAAVVATLTLAQPSHAVAPDTTVATWTSAQIKVYAAPVRGRGWKVNKAVHAWNAALNPVGVSLKVVGAPCTGCITVHEELDIPEYGPETVGIARWQFEFDISTNSYTHFTQCDIGVESRVSRQARPALVTHEIGHCIGLNHSERTDSVMFAEYNGVAIPNAVDLAWATAAYTK